MITHTYTSALHWAGGTPDYDSYSRRHEITVAGTKLTASADPAFRGDAGVPNPEQLVLAAASSCQLLSFLAAAALSGVDVLEYRDNAEAVMPGDQQPMRLASIVLRPRIVVRGASTGQVDRLLRKAHNQCYIANSLNADIRLEPSIEVR